MKKDILFVINNLNCGGGEKALISLLEVLDYSEYNVDLFLFKHEGIFFNKIPNQVNLLEEPSEYKNFDMSIKRSVIDCIKKGKIKVALSRVCAGFIFKTEKNKSRSEQRVWKYISRSINKIDKKYDVAIGYLEKNPVYFCIDKVEAKKKIGFIHNDYDKLGMDYNIDVKYFRKLDNLVTVSEECLHILKNRFPMYSEKIKLMHNIVSPKIINKMSMEQSDIKNNGITITSVGRLNYQKGFEIAVEACDLLIRNGFNIRWYVVGEGEERKKLEQQIKTKNLEDIFILIGLRDNPYPYIRQCDIYVQTSLFEGRCLTITEAKILKKPIVSTNFNVIYDQIENGVNGLIVNQDSKAVFEGIRRLIENEKLRFRLIDNLSREDLDNESEVQKLYNLCN
ncbi:glycosyltransferase [Cytobacillus sp. S13-E01]|uniref:glycosyltransferase n=1 Tax=Cytobacillus sp. S13-E01 TaxID=3031326 RepID=UPI0023D8C3ED|nr:glycosyltransferase [Cytobacillus sp. S13-E01]MDF0727759.1 glycosyltransferase [Cytobacillus sp. S13-E01]